MTAVYKNVRATIGTKLDNGDQPVLVKPGSAPAAGLVTDIATTLTDYDTFAAALIVITGDTYSTTTKQFTFGGSTGLTHSQWATLGALLNTALTALLLVQTDTAGVGVADVQLTFDATNVPTRTRLRRALEQMMSAVDGGLGGLTP